MKRKTEMKTSTLLKRTEKFLRDGKEPLLHQRLTLCGALGLAADGQGFRASRAHDNARHAIRGALGDAFYYTHWAIRNRHLPEHWRTWPKLWHPIIQANRLNWLRELQQQFKLKGD